MKRQVMGWLLWLSVAFATNASETMEVGVCMHMWQMNLPLLEVQKMMEMAQVTSWRDGLNWAAVERRPGVYRLPPQFEALMKAVDDAPSKGLRPMVIVGYGNPLYETGGLVTTPRARKAFADYASWLARRLKGKVRYYEIWNEWNIGAGSTTHPRTIGSVEDYVALVRVATAAIHKADPDAKVVAGGATNLDTSWFEAFGTTGVLDVIDGVSIHPYNYGRRPFAHSPEAAMAWVDLIQNELASQHRDQPVVMYITEIGWPAHSSGYPLDVVADYLQRFMHLALENPHVAGVWWYDLVNDGHDPHNREHNFGVFDRSYKPLPALEKLRACCRRP